MNPLLLICALYLFGSNIEANFACSCSTTEKRDGLGSALVSKLRELFGKKQQERERNIITYKFVKHTCEEKGLGKNENNQNKPGFEVSHVNRLIYINHSKTFILSAYIPYIYMSVRDIYIVLNKIKELNFNTVYTFLFWPENEYLEDFYDTSKSKLFYLLNFCASNGLFVILDIGPYIDNIYNANIPTYVLFSRGVNEYIRGAYAEGVKKEKKIAERVAEKIGDYFSFSNVFGRERNVFLNEDPQNVKREHIEDEIGRKKASYGKGDHTYNKVYSLYYFKRAIKWFNYILPQLKKYASVNNGPIIYLNIDHTFDNYYMYVIIDLKRRNYFRNLCNVESYLKGSQSEGASFLQCILNFFKRVRRSYILTLGYVLYARFNQYMRVLKEYELGVMYINEIYKLVQMHFGKMNTLTTNYPFIKDELINSYAGNNCYNHFFHNNWFDNECVKLNKPCIWSQVWTGAKYSIHNVNSPSILRRHFQEPIVYDSSPSVASPVSELVARRSRSFKREVGREIGSEVGGGNEVRGEAGPSADQSADPSEDPLENPSEDLEGNPSEDPPEAPPQGEIRVGVKRAQSAYSSNNYIGHIRNFKDLTYNILVFLAKGGVFLNIFPFYSGNNINNTHTYLEHYSKETGQPLDLYFNQKEPLYSHIKKIFKILYKYGHHLLKSEHYIRAVKISTNIEMYDYGAIKIICNHNIKGSTYVKVGPLNYSINSFSCIVYNEYKKKIIYDSSFNYSYEVSFINRKEVYPPIDKYLYSLDAAAAGPLMCLKEDRKEGIKSRTRGGLLPKSVAKHMKIFSNFFPNNYVHHVHEINVLNHFYVTLDFTKFQWYIISMRDDVSYVKLFLSNYSFYVYVYADGKFIYSGFNEYKYIELVNAKKVYIICANLGLGFPKENIRTDFLNHINVNDLKKDYFFFQDGASQNEIKKKKNNTNESSKVDEQNGYLALNSHTQSGKKKKKKKNMNGSGDNSPKGEHQKGRKTCVQSDVQEESDKEGTTNSTSNQRGSIFDDLEHTTLDVRSNQNGCNSMYDENERSVHNYYSGESTNTFVFIVTRNEYDLYSCVGLHGEIIKNEKNVEVYKKMYNMFDYTCIKPYLLNRGKRKGPKKGATSKRGSEKVEHKNMNFETLLGGKKTEMKSLTNSFINMCSSRFFSFFFNKIKYYCKTGIFKHLNKFSKVNENSVNSPLTWYTLLYFVKNVDYIRSKYSLKLSAYDEKLNEIDGLSRGFVYINNHMLGSFWITDDKESYENEINEEKKLKKRKKMKKEKKAKFATNENLISIPLTRYMRIPTDWLIEGINVVIVFDEFGGNPYKVEIVREVLQGGVYRLTKKEKYVNWVLFLFILSIVIFITYFCLKALHNYFKIKEEKERNKQNYQNIIENIITHNIYVNSSYDDATEETASEDIQNVSEFLDS
ncbi:conserved Plasmodium protein, unknown function [Plasmodium vivax]|uniref:Glycoside hydrolase 35 catalytic domain-containing protein n=4 Tax=Plasmodium vivax TaxID=5855 RepID=A0A0J9SRA0_PLAV1|nr:hypothetical protein PVBG_01987 [Plasmodium vivax Brazil I]CAG9473135.1 unnamed protein product [Plasmodium vivax]SCO73885.1 conserved Plasmodium protein, unknown function [Plasmodium vivax]